MTHHQSDQDTAKLRRALFKALKEERTGMLGVHGSEAHMQPMTHYVEEETNRLYFITARDTGLAQEVGSGAVAHFTVSSERETYACMKGELRPLEDRAKLEELWSPAAAMWFEGGIDDPQVLLMEMPLRDAEVWTVEANALQFGIEMVRANTSDHTADLGDHGRVPLAAA